MITATLVDSGGMTLSAQYDHENPSSGDTWLTSLEGWSGGVSVKGESLSRATHGDFPLRNYRTRRTLTLNFTAEREGRDALWYLERAISGLFSDGGFGSLTVEQDGDELSCEVELDGEPKVNVFLDGGYLEAEIPLSAPEPWLYSPWRKVTLRPKEAGIGLEFPIFAKGPEEGEPIITFGTAIETEELIWNDGNAKSFPVFTIYADAPGGFRVQLGNNTIAWPRPTFKTAPVEVYMDGKVIVGKHDQSQYLTERGWAAVAPHTMETPSFELLQGGTGWCDVTFRDTST